MAWELFALIAWMGLLWGAASLFTVACGKASFLVRFFSTLGGCLCALAFTLISAVLARYWAFDRAVSFTALLDQAIFLASDRQLWTNILLAFFAMQVLFFADSLIQKRRNCARK